MPACITTGAKQYKLGSQLEVAICGPACSAAHHIVILAW